MKNYIKLAAGVLLISCLAGCGRKEEVALTEIMPNNSELRIWAWDESFNVKAANLAAEKYNETHPHIKVKVVTKEKNEIMQELENGFSAKTYGNVPDIVLIEDYEMQALLSSYKDEFVTMDGILDYSLFQDYKAELTSMDGVHYGVPFDSGAAVMFYRKDYIEAAGYTEADMQNLTWGKYIEIARSVKEVTGVHMITVQSDDLGLIRIMMQSGGSWYVDQSGENADIVSNIPLREGLEIYKTLVTEDLALSVKGWDDFTDAFQTGKVATEVSGCWLTSAIKAGEGQSGLWRAAPIPRLENVEGAVQASNIGGGSWYVLKNRTNHQEAANFLKETFGEDKELLNELVREINLVSTRKDAGEFPAYRETEEFFGGTDIFQVFLETTRKVPVVNYGNSTYEIENILEEELQSIMKQETMEEGLNKVQVKAQQIIN